MTAKPSYSELQKKVKALEQELAGQRSIEKLLWKKQEHATDWRNVIAPQLQPYLLDDAAGQANRTLSATG